jgi:hypothetical protein
MHHSAFCHFSWQSNNYVHDSSTIEMWQKNALPSFLQWCRWVVARRTCTALSSLWSPREIHLAQTFLLPKLLVRIWQTLAGHILTYVATAMHEILHICSRTDFTCFPWYSSITDAGAPWRRMLSGSSRPFLMALIHQLTVSYEAAHVPKPSFDDLSQSSSLLSNKTYNFIHVSIVKPTRCTRFSNLFYFVVALCMFQTVFPSIIRSLRLYIQHQVYVNIFCWMLASGNKVELQFHLIPASNQSEESVWHILDAVCTVDSWRWTERPSKTCSATTK